MDVHLVLPLLLASWRNGDLDALCSIVCGTVLLLVLLEDELIDRLKPASVMAVIATVALGDGKRRRSLAALLGQRVVEAGGRADIPVLVLLASACALVVGPRVIQWLLTIEINDISLVEASLKCLIVLP